MLPIALSVLLLSQAAMAQLVQVGPGYVRAPFVRVYSYVDGSTYVRAPFVSVQTAPRRFMPRYAYAAPSYSVASPSTIDSRPASRKLALEKLKLLDRNLDESWRDYLHVDALEQILGEGDDNFLDDKQIEQLKDMLSNYQATINSPQVRHVSNAAGFRGLFAVLQELTINPNERALKDLVAAKRQLDGQLSRLSASSSWTAHLHLPIVSRSDKGDGPLPPGDNADDIAGLETALARYDQIVDDPEYRSVVKLPGFQRTRTKLTEYLQLVRGPSDGTHSSEQLPLPVPQSTELDDSASE